MFIFSFYLSFNERTEISLGIRKRVFNNVYKYERRAEIRRKDAWFC